jgi:hypothetical protein
MMKKLLLALILLSPLSFADWGDTYYCSTTLNWSVAPDGEGKPYVKHKETFKFHLDKQKQSLILGETASFATKPLKVTYSIFATDGQESFDMTGFGSSAAYHNGTFTYSEASTYGAQVVTAKCEKF